MDLLFSDTFLLILAVTILLIGAAGFWLEQRSAARLRRGLYILEAKRPVPKRKR